MHMEVSSRDVGRIIGRGGSRIRELQDQSGARIKIVKQDIPQDQTPVEITGSDDCKQKARELIEQVCSENNDGGGGRGGGGYGGGGGGGYRDGGGRGGGGYGGGGGGYQGGGGGYGGGGGGY